MIVRLRDENEDNPPFFIENQTTYDIYYRQSYGIPKGGCCKPPKTEITEKRRAIYPNERHRFTWDLWITSPYPHIIEAEVEG